MSLINALSSVPAESLIVTPFKIPAGDTPDTAAEVDRNVVSIRCEMACTKASRISISADGLESRSSSLEITESAATFRGVKLTSLKSALLTGIALDSPTQ